jgi:hypothetical protein
LKKYNESYYGSKLSTKDSSVAVKGNQNLKNSDVAMNKSRPGSKNQSIFFNLKQNNGDSVGIKTRQGSSYLEIEKHDHKHLGIASTPKKSN